MLSLEFRLWHEYMIETQLNKLYDLVSLEGFNASALHLFMSLNGLHEARWTWIHLLMHPFMHRAWIKAKSNICSIDMSHYGRQHHEFESVLWPLWMSALDCCSILSLTTSKCLIKLKWLKNNGDKYLWIAVLHGPMALRRLTISQLAKTSSSTPLPRCLPCPRAARCQKPRVS